MSYYAKEIAAHLLEIEAVKLQPYKPFTWTSGWKSPIYCDNRKTLSFPKVRKEIKLALAEMVKRKFPDMEVIAGVATGAIAQGALVADLLDVPFIYIREKEKTHGLGNVIEGFLKPGQKVVIIEDLISTGSSSLKAAEAVRAAGGEVLGMIANFTYEFPMAIQKFSEAKVELHTLTNYTALVTEAVKLNYVSESELETLAQWRLDPDNWRNDLKEKK